MTDDMDPHALAAARSSVETASTLGGLVALLLAKGVITDAELLAASDEIRDRIVAQAAAKYDLPVQELKESLG